MTLDVVAEKQWCLLYTEDHITQKFKHSASLWLSDSLLMSLIGPSAELHQAVSCYHLTWLQHISSFIQTDFINLPADERFHTTVWPLFMEPANGGFWPVHPGLWKLLEVRLCMLLSRPMASFRTFTITWLKTKNKSCHLELFILKSISQDTFK